MDAPATGAAEQRPEAVPPREIPAGPGAPPHQIEATLDHLAAVCARLEQAEVRFKQLTDQCEGVLQGLVSVDRRHSSVVAGLNQRLGDWCNLEGKLLEESARRIEQFERGIGHEWMVIRQLHEEPIAQLKEQADQLRLACLEAARLARFRLDSAEQAYTAYAADLERRMAEWSRELVKAAGGRVADGRPDAGAASLKTGAPALEPWPLEGVAQLHQELRAVGGAGAAAERESPTRDPEGSAGVPSWRTFTSSGSSAVTPTPAPAEERRPRRRARAVMAAAAVCLVAAALAVYAFSRPGPSAPSPSSEASAAPPVERAIVAKESAADDERLVEAQRAAERAGAMVEILAAPDLRRYALAGAATAPVPAPYGQVLWSRSRGLAVSASRLPPLPAGKVYQLWIVPDGPPIAAGALVPDAAGRASLMMAGPLKLPLPVTIRITLEDRGEAAVPRGPVFLQRVPTT